MGKSSQRKGAAGERELVEILNETYGLNVQRGGSRTFGTVPDLVGLDGIHIEVKRRERLNMNEAIAQATRDAAVFNDGFPAVFHRSNRKPWCVTMPLSYWLQLYRAYIKEEQKT